MKKTMLAVVLLVLVIAGLAGSQVVLNGFVHSGVSSTATSDLSAASSGEGSTVGTESSSTSTSTTSSSLSSSDGQQIAAGQIRHVIVIVMENEGYGSVMGNPSAPYENQLASSYALAGNYFAVSHPSLPNYMALVAGGTFGVTSDCLPAQCAMPGATITSLLDAKGLSWKEYAESMPSNCSQSDSQDGLYVVRHDPFVYFGAISGNSGAGVASGYCDADVVPFAQFSRDLASSDLPSYSFISPNICDDAHSCPLSTGDQWLSRVVPGVIGSSYFSSTALFIVYDEGSNNAGFGQNSGGQVVCILVSPFAKPGYVSQVQYSHYSIIATVEAIFNTGSLGRDDSTASVMTDMFSAPAPTAGPALIPLGKTEIYIK